MVTSGQFLLDSESKLREAVQKMIQAKMAPASDAAKTSPDGFFEDMESEKDDGFFKDMESEKDDGFFKDMESEKGDDFFKDMEAKPENSK